MTTERLAHHAVDAEVDGAVADEEDLLQTVSDQDVVGFSVASGVFGHAHDLHVAHVDFVEVQEDPGGVAQQECDGQTEEGDVEGALLTALGAVALLLGLGYLKGRGGPNQPMCGRGQRCHGLILAVRTGVGLLGAAKRKTAKKSR